MELTLLKQWMDVLNPNVLCISESNKLDLIYNSIQYNIPKSTEYRDQQAGLVCIERRIITSIQNK